ncbi:MAG: flagellar filament outer layer protein FlaA [Treponema sp.]|nr:flagellar filament outer layer protein FlaA [Treponema sp.]
MKRILVTILIFSASALAFGQNQVGAPDPWLLGVDTAQQFLQEVSVDRFEREGFWRGHISSDSGFITTRLFRGRPAGVQPIPAEEGFNIPNDYVLGARVDFIRRGHSSFTITAARPIPVEGITRLVSVWVVGRNTSHNLYLMIEDFFGRPFELHMGRLNFQGWQQLVVPIPPQAEDGFRGIVQRNFRYTSDMGIRIRGFRIVADPWESFGSHYIYFDELRAVTDLFADHHRDPDDMVDGW